MEQLYADNLTERYEQLAYHYDRSGLVEKAIEYLLKAGEKAQAAFANDTASIITCRPLLLVTEPVEQIDLHLQWGPVLERGKGAGRERKSPLAIKPSLPRGRGSTDHR